MNLNSKIKISEDLFVEKIDNEIVLLDTQTQEYFSLSEVGIVIWDILSDEKELRKVHNKLIDLYDVDSVQLENDLLNFIEVLVNKKLIYVD